MHSWRRVLLVFESHQLYSLLIPFISHLSRIVVGTDTVTIHPQTVRHTQLLVLWVIAQ